MPPFNKSSPSSFNIPPPNTTTPYVPGSIQQTLDRVKKQMQQYKTEKQIQNLNDAQIGVKEAARQRLAAAQRAALDEQARESVLVELRQELRPKIKRQLKRDLRQEVELELKQELHDSVSRTLREELTPNIKDEVTAVLKNQLKVSVIQQLRQDLQDDVIDELREDLRNGVYHDLREECRATVENDVREELLRAAQENGRIGHKSESVQPDGPEEDIIEKSNGHSYPGDYLDPLLQHNSEAPAVIKKEPDERTFEELLSGQTYSAEENASNGIKRRFSDSFDEEGGLARKRARSTEPDAKLAQTTGHSPYESEPFANGQFNGPIQYDDLYPNLGDTLEDLTAAPPISPYPIDPSFDREDSLPSPVSAPGNVPFNDDALSDPDEDEVYVDGEYEEMPGQVGYPLQNAYHEDGDDYDEEEYDEDEDEEEEYGEDDEEVQDFAEDDGTPIDGPGQSQDDPIMLDDD